MATGIDISILVVYIALLNPILYCLWKHGRPGILGWVALQAFCIIRIVGSILDLHNNKVHSSSSDSLLLSNIGLSPLLLAALGVLHEARTARNPNINSKWEWVKVIQYHILIIGAIVLVIIGVIKEVNDEPHVPGVLMKVGVLGVLLSWAVLCVWTVLSLLRSPENTSQNPAYADGTTLLRGVLCSLPCVFLRELYAMLSIFVADSNFKNNTAGKVVLSVVPEMLVTLIFVFAGIKTRGVGKLRNKNEA